MKAIINWDEFWELNADRLQDEFEESEGREPTDEELLYLVESDYESTIGDIEDRMYDEYKDSRYE